MSKRKLVETNSRNNDNRKNKLKRFSRFQFKRKIIHIYWHRFDMVYGWLELTDALDVLCDKYRSIRLLLNTMDEVVGMG